jgi:hypothetical protein
MGGLDMAGAFLITDVYTLFGPVVSPVIGKERGEKMERMGKIREEKRRVETKRQEKWKETKERKRGRGLEGVKNTAPFILGRNNESKRASHPSEHNWFYVLVLGQGGETELRKVTDERIFFRS